MNDFLNAVSHTPLPTILVVAGILFWVLAISGSLAGRITIQQARQRIAGVVGTALIVLGVALFFAPSTQDPLAGTTTALRTSESPAPARAPGPATAAATPASTGGPLIIAVPPNRTVWALASDKSTVYLEATGDRRQFFLVEPSIESAKQGAQSGGLLFDGRNVNETTYEGKVLVYAGRCGTHEYEASGPISGGGLTVTLTGTAPQIDLESCDKTGEQQKTLVINYKYRAQ